MEAAKRVSETACGNPLPQLPLYELHTESYGGSMWQLQLIGTFSECLDRASSINSGKLEFRQWSEHAFLAHGAMMKFIIRESKSEKPRSTPGPLRSPYSG